jgi:hypothetical protein
MRLEPRARVGRACSVIAACSVTRIQRLRLWADAAVGVRGGEEERGEGDICEGLPPMPSPILRSTAPDGLLRQDGEDAADNAADEGASARSDKERREESIEASVIRAEASVIRAEASVIRAVTPSERHASSATHTHTHIDLCIVYTCMCIGM